MDRLIARAIYWAVEKAWFSGLSRLVLKDCEHCKRALAGGDCYGICVKMCGISDWAEERIRKTN